MRALIIPSNIPTILIPGLMVADIPLCKETIMAEHPVIMIEAMIGIEKIFRTHITTNTMSLPVGTTITQDRDINTTYPDINMKYRGINMTSRGINLTKEKGTATGHMTIEGIITRVAITLTIARTTRTTTNLAIPGTAITTNMAIPVTTITTVETIVNALMINKLNLIILHRPKFRWLYWELISIMQQ
ncbi:MAG: hypothetical protein WAV82_07430 [Methylobacter sp.]